MIIPIRLGYNLSTISYDLSYLISVWGNFDGIHYLEIAKYGYSLTLSPFFPLYPLTIFLLSLVLKIEIVFLAQLVSTIFFIAAIFVVLKLVKLDKYTKLSYLITLIILTYPTSFYYVAVYNDSFFFFLASLSLLLIRRKKMFFACLVGGMATLTRLNGLALFFPILIEGLNLDYNFKNNIEKIKKLKLIKVLNTKIYFSLLIPLSFLLFLFYNYQLFGDFTTPFSAMKNWNQDRITLPLQVFWRYFRILFLDPQLNLSHLIAGFELFFVVVYLVMLLYSYKKIRFSYWIFFLISILIPALTGTFQGMPRYGLHIYPFFLSLTLFLEKKNEGFKTIYLLISILILILFTMFFTRGYFVS